MTIKTFVPPLRMVSHMMSDDYKKLTLTFRLFDYVYQFNLVNIDHLVDL